MSFPVLFGTTVVFGMAIWGVVAWLYIWPALRRHTDHESLRPILLLHGFRFLGLSFLVPGVVSPELPYLFARPVAYGDFITAVLALLALVTLGARAGTAAAWVYQCFRNGGPALCLLLRKWHITGR